MRKLSRRRFLRLTLFGLGATAAAWCGGPAYGFFLEAHWLRLRRVRVSLPGLPSHLDGFRLALLTDLHRSDLVAQEQIGRAVDLALRAEPDLVLLGGDYVTGSASFASSCAEELARLRAPAGVYGCLGNHDHWTDPASVAEALAGAGVQVLRNRGVEAAPGLWLAAVDDVWEEQADLDAALEEAPPGATVVLLAHEPDFADVAAADGRVSLQLSGHSHGGQVRLPLLGPPVLPYLAERYSDGLYRVGGMWLYVSRGVGLVSPPVRFNCRPEVAVVELRREV